MSAPRNIMSSFVVFGIVIFGACALVNAQDVIFSNKEMGFSISLPSDWKQEGSVETEGVAQRLKLVDEKSQEAITITKGPAFTDFKNEIISNLRQDKIDPNLIVEDVDFGGVAGLKTVIKLTAENLQESLPAGVDAVESEVYFVNAPLAGYIVSATATSPDIFNADKVLFEKIISTFRVEK